MATKNVKNKASIENRITSVLAAWQAFGRTLEEIDAVYAVEATWDNIGQGRMKVCIDAGEDEIAIMTFARDGKTIEKDALELVPYGDGKKESTVDAALRVFDKTSLK